MNKYADVTHGTKIFYCTGELSYETNPREAGVFEGTFLEPRGEDFSQIINKKGKLQVIHNSLISLHNI